MNLYGKKYPELDELVIVRIVKVEDFMTTVALTEYNDIEAIILPREISRKRSCKVNKIMKIGKKEVMKILRVSNGSIDLTKKDLTEEEIKNKIDQHSKLKKIYNMIKYISETFLIDFEELLSKVLWPHFNGGDSDSDDEICSEEENSENENKYFLIEKILNDLSKENIKNFEFDEKVEDAFIKQILLKFPSKKFKLELLMDINCYSEWGIDGIKNAVRASRVENVDIRLVSSPTFRITTETCVLKEGEENIMACANKICEELLKWGGKGTIKKELQISCV